MVDRISLLLRAKNINASQFADEIGVQRSSISHVLSGRNKPSLEFVQKILKRYPEISPDWLLFGKGPMNMEVNLFSQTSESVPLKEEVISKALRKSERMIRSVSESDNFEPTRYETIKDNDKELVNVNYQNISSDNSLKQTDNKEDKLTESQEERITGAPKTGAPTPVVPPPADFPAQVPQAHSTPPSVTSEQLPAGRPAGEKSIEKVLVFFSNRTFREYNPE